MGFSTPLRAQGVMFLVQGKWVLRGPRLHGTLTRSLQGTDFPSLGFSRPAQTFSLFHLSVPSLFAAESCQKTPASYRPRHALVVTAGWHRDPATGTKWGEGATDSVGYS